MSTEWENHYLGRELAHMYAVLSIAHNSKFFVRPPPRLRTPTPFIKHPSSVLDASKVPSLFAIACM